MARTTEAEGHGYAVINGTARVGNEAKANEGQATRHCVIYNARQKTTQRQAEKRSKTKTTHRPRGSTCPECASDN